MDSREDPTHSRGPARDVELAVPRGAPFPTTCWSRLAAAEGDAAAARAALDVLARRYWRPIASYVRARWAKSDEEALDATQGFFLWMMERGFVTRADPARGRFRAFVKASLENYLRDLERERRTLKRGGGAAFLGLDELEEGASVLPDPSSRSPEELLDDLWRRTLFREAAELLEEELCARGKPVAFALFRDRYLAEETLGHEELARRHGVSRVDVSNHLTRAKQRFRAHLRRLVLETVGEDEELRVELAWLLEGEA